MTNDLTQGPIGSWLYRLTAPMVLGILAIFLFNLIDTYFIGLLGTEPLAAVSFTFPVTMVIMNIAIGLSIATGALVSRAIGQKNPEKAAQWILSSLYLAIILGLSLAFIAYVFLQPLFLLLGATEQLMPMIIAYMNWWLMGSVFLIIIIIINSSIRASGNTKFPSLLMLASAVLNGILDPLLIFGLGPFPELGIKGAAMATFISWFAAFLLLVHYLFKNRLLPNLLASNLMASWKKLLSLGIPAALTNMLGPVANGILVAWVASYGTSAVAAYGVGSRLEPLAVLMVLAFTASLPPFVGQNHGAGKDKRIEQALIKSMKFILVWQMLIYIVLALLADTISGLFSDDENVTRIIKMFIYILPISYFGLGFSMVITSTLNALHKPRYSLYINALRLFILYLPFSWIGNHYFGLNGLFAGCALANITIGIVTIMLFNCSRHHDKWRHKLLKI